MESLGEKLKEARINKGYSLDQIAQETYISKRFVMALEVEDFSVFPGETYLIGFLRNYAEYLGLDSESLITLYKNIKIQEQPLPMNELIHGKKNLPSTYVLILAIVGAVLLGGGTTLFLVLGNQNPETTAEAEGGKPLVVTEVKNQGSGKEAYLKEVALTDEFKTGDRITVPYGEDKLYEIEVGPIEKDLVTFLLPADKKLQMQVAKAEVLELEAGSDAKLKISLNNIMALGGLSSKINVSLTKLGAQMSPLEQTAAEVALEVEKPLESETQNPGTVTQPTTVQMVVPGEQMVLALNERPKLFTVKAEFNNSCFFRYLIDGKTQDQQFFQKNSQLQIDTAYQSVKIWASNGGAVKLKVEGQDLTLGRQGQVVTKLIKWVKEGDSTKYKLVINSTP